MNKGLVVVLSWLVFFAGWVTGVVNMLQARSSSAAVGASVVFIDRAPTCEPIAPLPIAPPPDDYSSISAVNVGSGSWHVCATVLDVRAGPADTYAVVDRLGFEDAIQIEEWGRGSAAGWARLGTRGSPGVKWVDGTGVCR